jgi:hypothetical protein
MTAQVMPVVEREDGGGDAGAPLASGAGSMLWLFVTTLVAPFAPRWAGRRWLQASIGQAAAVGGMHLVLGIGWVLAVVFSAHVWGQGRFHMLVRHNLVDEYVWNLEGLRHSWETFFPEYAAGFHSLTLYDKVAGAGSVIIMMALALALPFFILLPLGARPGKNRPAVRHVARTVILGLGFGHVWAIGIAAVFWGRIVWPGDPAILNYLRILTPMLLTLTGLGLWTWIALGRIVRLDYRTEADLPEPHDPWCDECGYNLIAADTNGRCPECGRPVIESIGHHKRQPTAWERRPALSNVGVILRLIKAIVLGPRKLFFSMPTLTGQAAAHRWLFLSLTLAAVIALPIVPAMGRVVNAEWSIDLVSGALAMALVWAALSCMMVGIETAGIATFSRMKGHGVHLSTAAKVTCYASILLTVWVICGGIQLVVFMVWGQQLIMAPLRPGSMRTHQILLAAALALPHMAGLLWYELTVYRGIRGVQYANK